MAKFCDQERQRANPVEWIIRRIHVKKGLKIPDFTQGWAELGPVAIPYDMYYRTGWMLGDHVVELL